MPVPRRDDRWGRKIDRTPKKHHGFSQKKIHGVPVEFFFLEQFFGSRSVDIGEFTCPGPHGPQTPASLLHPPSWTPLTYDLTPGNAPNVEFSEKPGGLGL